MPPERGETVAAEPFDGEERRQDLESGDEPAEWDSLRLGRLRQTAAGVAVRAIRTAQGTWDLAFQGAGGIAALTRVSPVRIELYDREGHEREYACGYATVEPDGEGWLARAALAVPGTATFIVEDRWTVDHEDGDSVLCLSRTVTVAGDAPGGFLSAITLRCDRPLSWLDVAPFAPGVLYGLSEHVTGVAIGGVANYLAGVRQVRIREDRLPAPLFGLHFGDGSSVALLDRAPHGDTTAADALDTEALPLIDERFRFAALGGEERDGHVALSAWYPGTEGAVTYSGDTFPGGQLARWRRRYHPIRDGLTQHYQLAIRLGRDERFVDFRTAAWRWAWRTLRPAVVPQDIDAARQSLVAMLGARVVTVGDRASIPIACDATTGEAVDHRAVMGFVGRNVESAYVLLRDGRPEQSEYADPLVVQDGDVGRAGDHTKALAILESFVRLPVAPPEAEGFSLVDGSPACNVPGEVYLRSLCEGWAAALRAWQVERAAGRDRPHWLAWSRAYADWLLTQEYPGGGFPRVRLPGAGTVRDASPESSYHAIPFLALLAGLTGEQGYLDAAVRAGAYCWADGQADGMFVGGTIDNPNVVDKEAGTVSLEAYLALYEATRDAVWLRRAVAAGDYAETWIYLWDVPMPPDDDDARRHWKRGVSTVGLQLIASGHSMADAYMAFDVGSYARLYRYTGDAHYREVARLLLHNTKIMLALPGRAYDLAGPGWQQEHWSLAPRRGYGIHPPLLVAVGVVQPSARPGEPAGVRRGLVRAVGARGLMRPRHIGVDVIPAHRDKGGGQDDGRGQ